MGRAEVRWLAVMGMAWVWWVAIMIRSGVWWRGVMIMAGVWWGLKWAGLGCLGFGGNCNGQVWSMFVGCNGQG